MSESIVEFGEESRMGSKYHRPDPPDDPRDPDQYPDTGPSGR